MTQTQPGFDELLREGGAALRGGERERARALLAQAVRLNPRSEQAWLLLAGAVTDPEQRRTCLERVLRLNPEHTTARKALATVQAASPAAAASDDRRPAADERPQARPAAAASADQPQAPSAGSLLGRLRQPEPPAGELPSFEQLLAGPSPASPPQPAPAAQQPAPASPQPAPPAQQPRKDLLNFEQLVATPPAASPQPSPTSAPQELASSLPSLPASSPSPADTGSLPAASVQQAAAKGATPGRRPAAGVELIELSMAGAQRRKRERQLWMVALAVGVLMMLAGLGLALLVLLTG